ncbi:glycoside hydrolase family 1 protein [Rhodococcus sp. AD45-ID]|uniref:glycoside hydrolase family 1 protein n=1 Tax=unclassified Rhodococcus (in: high G+C Gram-positive bacteria) TaxID=192944 RepID=UPI0005D44168|nr:MULTISPECIES: family 1 glycosylhydrolase [unclassified Rhodococcus (in: high G+C Gram-positive bacteria)]KJF19773.1 Beta-glucosidase B [Rhodococcus sp. AD45]PSR40941.1 glycoside hydrolase family 1 protein [Rhodococcus sp. AD45-ID]
MGVTSRSIAAALLALVIGAAASPAQASGTPSEEFLWGVATSGFQSEGSSPDSNWSRYSASGRTHDAIGDSVDFRHRFTEDIDRAADLGAQVFRFGVEWARVQPSPGTWNDTEFGYYDAVVAHILARGMTPMITLDHWVYPGWVVDQGGWTNPKTEADWLTSAEKVVARYSGVGALWITINEPTVYVQRELTYGGITLPQAPLMFDALVRVHRSIYDRIHVLDPGARVSSNFAFIPGVSEAIDSVFTDRVSDKLDFLGIDYYYGVALDNPTAAYAAIDEFYNVTPQPEGLYDALMRYSRKYPELPLYVVENGMPTDNGNPRPDGYTRSNHLSDHVYWMERAREDGADVIGYNYWSITDNYEWGSYRPRFGLYTVDVLTDPTLTRTPTDGVETYRNIIEDNGVGPDYVPVKAPAFCSLVDPPLSCTNTMR